MKRLGVICAFILTVIPITCLERSSIHEQFNGIKQALKEGYGRDSMPASPIDFKKEVEANSDIKTVLQNISSNRNFTKENKQNIEKNSPLYYQLLSKLQKNDPEVTNMAPELSVIHKGDTSNLPELTTRMRQIITDPNENDHRKLMAAIILKQATNVSLSQGDLPTSIVNFALMSPYDYDSLFTMSTIRNITDLPPNADPETTTTPLERYKETLEVAIKAHDEGGVISGIMYRIQGLKEQYETLCKDFFTRWIDDHPRLSFTALVAAVAYIIFGGGPTPPN